MRRGSDFLDMFVCPEQYEGALSFWSGICVDEMFRLRCDWSGFVRDGSFFWVWETSGRNYRRCCSEGQG